MNGPIVKRNWLKTLPDDYRRRPTARRRSRPLIVNVSNASSTLLRIEYVHEYGWPTFVGLAQPFVKRDPVIDRIRRCGVPDAENHADGERKNAHCQQEPLTPHPVPPSFTAVWADAPPDDRSIAPNRSTQGRPGQGWTNWWPVSRLNSHPQRRPVQTRPFKVTVRSSSRARGNRRRRLRLLAFTLLLLHERLTTRAIRPWQAQRCGMEQRSRLTRVAEAGHP